MIIPEFKNSPAELESFADAYITAQYNINFPTDTTGRQTGGWFKNCVSDYGAKTQFFMNSGTTLWEMATKDVPEADHMTSMNMTSIMFIQALPIIIKKMSEKLPDKLKALHWRCTKLSYSNFNPKQFHGMNKQTGEPMYGVSTSMIVADLDYLDAESIPVCKPTKVFAPRAERTERTERNEHRSSIANTYSRSSPKEDSKQGWTDVVNRNSRGSQQISRGGGAFRGRPN
jgi:hypothetical protein